MSSSQNEYNCKFYNKIGACRHGDSCARMHNKPDNSQTILMSNLYINPKLRTLIQKGQIIENAPKISDVEEQAHFDEFFEEVYMEIENKYGQIQEMNICQNLGKHLNGNVYVKFYKERDADKAVLSLNNRWFGQRPINAELSPVKDFHFACCPEYDRGECLRGDFCNFMHLKPISKALRRRLESIPVSIKRKDRGSRSEPKFKRSRSGTLSSSSSCSNSDGSRSRRARRRRNIPRECLRR